MYPLAEVLLLLTCATICSCDDSDEIAAWGESHLPFPRRFLEFHFGIPGERWLRDLVNRVDPILLGRCFENWIGALWPDRHDLIAIDGKTSRRTGDKRKRLKALHTLSAYAANARLTLAQLSVPEKTNEIADKIVAHGADYLLALKGDQPTLEADAVSYFETAPAQEIVVRPRKSRRGVRQPSATCSGLRLSLRAFELGERLTTFRDTQRIALSFPRKRESRATTRVFGIGAGFPVALRAPGMTAAARREVRQPSATAAD